MRQGRTRHRAVRAAFALVLALTGCSGGGPALQRPDVEAFDPEALIDVLPPDTIRAVRSPAYESQEEAAGWLAGDEPVVAVSIGEDARAYPVGILIRHEIVNDRLGGRPVAVTYCPLCNSAVVYERATNGLTLTFLVSGKLYHSDLVMLDQQTRSLWPQMLGAAVAGELRGTELRVVASSLVSFDEFRLSFPDGSVLARPDDVYPYELTPYVRYDDDGPYREFFTVPPDERLEATERVVGVAIGDGARAYPFASLSRRGDPVVVHDTVGGQDIVVIWRDGQRSAMDARVIADGRRVGSSGVFEPILDGRRLTLVPRDGDIIDEETGTAWSVLGVGLEGPLAGRRLPPLPHVDAFWFAWAAFVPHTDVWRGPVAASGIG